MKAFMLAFWQGDVSCIGHVYKMFGCVSLLKRRVVLYLALSVLERLGLYLDEPEVTRRTIVLPHRNDVEEKR